MKENKPTFSQQVKNEIIENSAKLQPCCMLAGLSAVAFCGEISLTDSGVGFGITSSNLSFVKFVANICHKLYGVSCDILAQVASNGRTEYSLTVNHRQLLFDCGLLYLDSTALTQIADCTPTYLLEEDCCKKSYITACFLANGNVVVPKSDGGKTGYKLEFSLRNEQQCNLLMSKLQEFGFVFKCLQRKNSFSVYIQESDAVCDMLIFLGASNSMLSLESVKIELSMRSRINRQTNCEVANIDKSIAAAQEQISSIRTLIEKGKMNFIDGKLQEIANARMENPSATMAELAMIVGITKSGANHRMRKIMQLAEEDGRPTDNN